MKNIFHSRQSAQNIRLKDIERQRLMVEVKNEAERMVLRNFKEFLGKENATNPSALKWAKKFTHRQVDIIILELMTHHQNDDKGINRLEYWKELKLHINDV